MDIDVVAAYTNLNVANYADVNASLVNDATNTALTAATTTTLQNKCTNATCSDADRMLKITVSLDGEPTNKDVVDNANTVIGRVNLVIKKTVTNPEVTP